MASEGTSTVPRMGSFKRALFGYRPSDVEAAIASRDARNWALERDAEEALKRWREAADAAAAAEQELAGLSTMVIEREREIRGLHERLVEANERHDRSIASLETVSSKLGEIQAQARGQATRIRMKALREAVEVGRRAQELNEAEAGASEPGPIEQAAQNLFEGLVKVEIDRREVGLRRDRADRRHLRHLGRAFLGGSRDPLDAPQRTGGAAARA